MDKDNRLPACCQLTYRGCIYWSCYLIHLDEWFEIYLNQRVLDEPSFFVYNTFVEVQ